MVASKLTSVRRRADRSLTLRYLRRRLRRLNRRVRSDKVTDTDYIQRERVANQLEEAKKFR